jgi:DMSO/TMAO reductase YedYZ molybdopterin-dependent catalytic subunit
MNGSPLDPRQGRPLRLILPWMYGYKGPKWVERIELTDSPFSGYWEQRGYPTDADLPS